MLRYLRPNMTGGDPSGFIISACIVFVILVIIIGVSSISLEAKIAIVVCIILPLSIVLGNLIDEKLSEDDGGSFRRDMA